MSADIVSNYTAYDRETMSLVAEISFLFEPKTSPVESLTEYWDQFAKLDEVKRKQKLSIAELSELASICRRKIEYMYSVCTNIDPGERDRYLSIAEANSRRLSPKVLEIISSRSPAEREFAINVWAKQDLSVRGLQDFMRNKFEKRKGGCNPH